MHQTTVRFGPDLWRDLAGEAEIAGVSVAQFVRDGALARVVYTRARRGDQDLGEAFAAVESPLPVPEALQARTGAASAIEAATALQAQGDQARRRARDLRERSQRARAGRHSTAPTG